MATGVFRNWTLEQLLELKASATQQMLDGKNRIVTTIGEGSVQVSKDWILTGRDFWEELNWALEQKDPASFTPGIRRTVLNYSRTQS